MSDMLNQRHALAKLRAELEGREGRICRKYGRLGTLPESAGVKRNRRKKQ